MKIKQPYLFFFFLMVILPACDLWDFERVDFPSVQISTVEFATPTAIKVTGTIEGVEKKGVTDHGIVWLADAEDPTLDNNDGRTSLGGRTTNGDFYSLAEGLKPNTLYYFRAYLLPEDRGPVYSDPVSYLTGASLQVITLPEITFDGLELSVYGWITGFDYLDPGDEVQDFGHLWSSQSSEPTLEGSNYEGKTDGNGPLTVDSLYSSIVQPLAERTTIYYRSYAILNDVPIYGSVESFCFTSWQQRSDFPAAVANATAFVLEDKAYVGTGERIGPTYQDSFHVYDPATDDWQPVAPFGGGGRSGAVSFTASGHGFVGLGENNTGRFNDFWLYDVDYDEWFPVANFPGAPRSGAVSFVLGERVFVGTGKNGNTYLDDFWEYDPVSDSWSAVPAFPGGARSGAVSFVVNGKGYVGTGNDGASYFDDFWEFDPGSGSWQQVPSFPGQARTEAIAISVGEFAILTLGASDNNAGPPLGDFWVFDPSLPPFWFDISFFLPDELKFRSEAIGFFIGDTGYIGLGRSTIETRRYFLDFWDYKTLCE